MAATAVITGGSSGIGQSCARLFCEKGYTVYELSRSGKSEGGIRHITADITKPHEVAAAFEAIFAAQGRIDLLVNNAGMGISGAIEFTELDAAKRIFDVNFFGMFTCCKAALPYLRQSEGGRIINLSSVAAPISIPFQAFYSATKAAVNSFTMALANEVRPFGIRVSALMPGDVHTGFTSAREKSEIGSQLYGQAIERAVSSMEKDELGGMSPELVAGLIFKISQCRHPKVLYTAGGKYRLFVIIAKLLPATVCNRLVGKIYG